jgi:ABC-2 type transport system ATP-binding protein
LTATTSPLLVHAVSKSYGKPFRPGRWALRTADMDLPAGSVTALVGPNGAGKTTLIGICMAFERPSSGHVEVRRGRP